MSEKFILEVKLMSGDVFLIPMGDNTANHVYIISQFNERRFATFQDAENREWGIRADQVIYARIITPSESVTTEQKGTRDDR